MSAYDIAFAPLVPWWAIIAVAVLALLQHAPSLG